MSLLKTTTRYTIDTLISIAKITGMANKRERLLDEALELLRGKDYEDDIYGIDSFLSQCEPGGIPRKATDIYRHYKLYCTEEEFDVLPRKAFCASLNERGYLSRTLQGYKVFDIRFKEAE